MSKIRVAIDVDGVLRDFVGKTMELAEEKGVYIGRPTSYDYIDNFYIENKSLRHWIWKNDKFMTKCFVDAKELPFAKKGYDKFCEDDLFEVHIVTSQKEGTEQYTERWLNEHGYDKHDKTYYTMNKLTAPSQILIDDNVKNVQEYIDNMRDAYLVSCSYNLDSNFKPRVSNILEAYNRIKERYGKRD